MGGVYADGVHGPVATIPVVVKKISELIATLPDDAPEVGKYEACRYSLAEFAGEVFLVVKLRHHFLVFKLNNDSGVFEPVNGIGNLAIFIGSSRSFTVDASKLLTVDANCIYYLISIREGAALLVDNRKYDLKDEKEETTSDLYYPESAHTIVHYLSGHTMDVQDYQLD